MLSIANLLALKPVLTFFMIILSFSGVNDVQEIDEILLFGSDFNSVLLPFYSLEREVVFSNTEIPLSVEKDIVLSSEKEIQDDLYSSIVITEPELIAVPISESVSVTVPDVPFFSQSTDIDLPEWRSRACGVASLAMVVELYYPGRTNPQELLEDGLKSGHYLYGVGWTHQGLALLAKEYGLKNSRPYDLSAMSMDNAYKRLLESLENGPVIASIYHKFDPQSPIPHLAVINGVDGNKVFYNDPDEHFGGRVISVSDFMAGWKKRFIAVHP